MTRDEARAIVKDGLEHYIQSKGINTSRAFRCLNPEHNDKHASMSIDRGSKSGLHCKCFSCNAYYDTFDLIAIDYGISDELELFNKAYEIFSLQVEGAGVPKASENRTNYTTKATQPKLHNFNYTTPITQDAEELEPTLAIDLTKEIQQAHEELLKNKQAIEHFTSRGISLDIIKKYKLGYTEGGHNTILKAHTDHQAKSKKIELYKYIFPYTDAEGKNTYFMSEIADRAQVDEYNDKYRKINKGNTSLQAPIFNERYLEQGDKAPEVIFICEGIFDALSVEEVGGNAIAFSGTAHKRFIQLCKKYKPASNFVIALDNDNAGQQAIDKVIEGLDSLDLPYIVRTAANGKDFNDSLQADRGSLVDYIEQVKYEATEERRKQAEAEKAEYMQTATAYYLQDFLEGIEKSKTANYYSTGFKSIDNLLDGGLYAGLYCIGAISSLGKTTFCLQVLDNIASSGKDVLIFSLEMARTELIAKSVSRHTLLEDLKQYQSTSHAKTTRGITTGTRYQSYKQEDRQIIADAVKAYSKYSYNIYIHEGVGNIGIDQIRKEVEEHIRITGNSPAVLIDYLQIIAPYSDRATDKQNTDKAVIELKRLSRDYAIPIIGISSFNRDNYTAPVNMASFKESGAVEYSSDVLLALQYEGMDYVEGENEKTRNQRVRELMRDNINRARDGKPQSIQVKVLKNRNGSKGDTAIDFYPMFNYFTEKDKAAGALALPAADSEGSEWQTVSTTDKNPLPFE